MSRLRPADVHASIHRDVLSQLQDCGILTHAWQSIDSPALERYLAKTVTPSCPAARVIHTAWAVHGTYPSECVETVDQSTLHAIVNVEMCLREHSVVVASCGQQIQPSVRPYK